MTVTRIVSSDLGDIIPKTLVPYGLSLSKYRDAEDAKGYTYTMRDGGFPPTPFFSTWNPVNQEMLDAKHVMEIGPGVGRNLPIIMEQTSAHYYGVDPNEEMLKHFWTIQDTKWKDRVTLVTSFDQLPTDVQMDVVIVTFVFQHIGFRPGIGQMNVADITKEAMKHVKFGGIWFVVEHQREEHWQDRWIQECGIVPIVYFKPGGEHWGGGVLPYPEFECMVHRGNDNNIIIFKQ